jgi:hypothetical protein
MPTIGRLERVDLRKVWISESASFTPWLARPENLALLGETLGLSSIELVQTEHPVDVYSCDIVAKVVHTGDLIVIENQLERSDHSHLGQILTYTAGVEASAVVWVAQKFTDGHRAALEWLNRKTTDDLAVFAVEIEAWRIGESIPAPKFNIIVRPNQWARALTSSARSSSDPETNAVLTEYWRAYEDIARSLKAPYRGEAARPASGNNYYTYADDLKKVGVVSYVSRPVAGNPAVGAYVGLWGDHAAGRFHSLKTEQAQIEEKFGTPLNWQEVKGKASTYYWILAELKSADYSNRIDWGRQHSWLAETMKKLQEVVIPRAFSDPVKENERPTS